MSTDGGAAPHPAPAAPAPTAETFAQMVAAVQQLQTTVQAQAAELTAAREQAAAAQAAATAAGSSGATSPTRARGIDTRLLGKPQDFHGEASAWQDWSTVFKGYAGAVIEGLSGLMRKAAVSALPVPNSTISSPVHVAASEQLYWMLLMLCKGPALTTVTLPGDGNGLESWRLLVEKFEPKLRTRYAGQLMQILSYNLQGDLLERLAAWERDIAVYERDAQKKLDDDFKIGTFMLRLPESTLKTHLLVKVDSIEKWVDFREQIIAIYRAMQVASSTPVPMDVSALGPPTVDAIGAKGKKGGRGKGACWNCGQQGHREAQCPRRASGVPPPPPPHPQQRHEAQQQPCDRCGGWGHTGTDCRHRETVCLKCGRQGHLAAVCRNGGQAPSKGKKGPKGGGKGKKGSKSKKGIYAVGAAEGEDWTEGWTEWDWEWEQPWTAAETPVPPQSAQAPGLAETQNLTAPPALAQIEAAGFFGAISAVDMVGGAVDEEPTDPVLWLQCRHPLVWRRLLQQRACLETPAAIYSMMAGRAEIGDYFEIEIDSGAEVSAIPMQCAVESYGIEHDAFSRGGGYYLAAGGGKLYDSGSKTLNLEGRCGGERPKSDGDLAVRLVARFKVLDVGKALLSTHDLSECGWKTVFPDTDHDAAYIVHKASGTRLDLLKKRRAWYLGVRLLPPDADVKPGHLHLTPPRGAAGSLQQVDGETAEAKGSTADEHQGEEAAPSRKMVQPRTPTRAEREEHLASGHAVFRSWCRECCVGRGRMGHHLQADGDAKQLIPVCGVDYGYLNDRTEDGQELPTAPILCSRCTGDRWLGGALVPSKGVDEYAVGELKNDILGSNSVEYIIRSDNEPSILALKSRVATALRLEGMQAKLEESAAYDSRGNGLAEGAVREVKDGTRTNLACLFARYGKRFNGNHPVVPWLVKYTTAMINRRRIGPDGRTAYELRKGRPFKKPLPTFAEKILFFIPGSTKGPARVEPRWEDGVFLGISDRSDELFVGTPDGVHRARTVRQREATERFDAAFLDKLAVRPWDTITPARQPIVVLPDIPVGAPAANVPAAARRVYLTKADFLRHGYSAGCPGCAAMVAGGAPRPHSEVCRARLEAKLAETDAGRLRLTRAYLRALPGRRADGGEAEAMDEDGPEADEEQPAAKRAAPAVVEGAAAPAAPVVAAAPAASSSGGGAAAASSAQPAASSGSPLPKPVPVPGQDEEEQSSKRLAIAPPAAAASSATASSAAALRGDGMDLAAVAAEGLGISPVALAEVYSPARFGEKAAQFGLVPGVALDLRTGWDLGDKRQQQRAERRLEEDNPWVLILSPMCLPFSQLQRFRTAGPERMQQLLAWGRAHLEFSCYLAKRQLQRGGRVLHEHPWSASSWQEPCVKELLAWPGVTAVRCDQCLFGQVAIDASGWVGPARKATGFLTNDRFLAKELDKRCYGGHEHVQLLNGTAKASEVYPPRLVAAILRGIRSSMIAAGKGVRDGLCARPETQTKASSAPIFTIQPVEAGPTLEEPELLERLPKDSAEKQVFDKSTGLPLDPQLVKASRAEEMAYMEELEVLKPSTEDACLAATGRPPIPTAWVDIDKGDRERPNVRSRLVAQETRWRSALDPTDWAATFAATPPYEAFKMQLSMLMTGARPESPMDERVLMLIDISRAHLHSPLDRDVFVRVDGVVYQLCKAMYGLRDAGASFDRKVEKTMGAMDVTLGKFSVCLGVRYMDGDIVRQVRWGDDFSVSGKRASCQRYKEDLSQHLLVKVVAILGPNSELGDTQEAIHLNRLIRWYPPGSAGGERIELEADPRHAEILVQQMGLGDGRSKPAVTPGVKPADDDDEGAADDELLDDEGRSNYRSWTMRASYLGLDRPEIQFTCKELARHMQGPRQSNLKALKRLVRFLKGQPRCILTYARQRDQDVVALYSDSNWAGCKVTRRSTSSSFTMHGSHLLHSTSTTQSVIATSSGEAEFYALTKAASRALGAVAMARDLALNLRPRVKVDASASKGIASRRGVGRIRHLHTQVLWVQEACARRELAVDKLPGAENPADLGTKYLGARALTECLRLCSCRLAQGRSEVALKAAFSEA